jgi:hypothetical protein
MNQSSAHIKSYTADLMEALSHLGSRCLACRVPRNALFSLSHVHSAELLSTQRQPMQKRTPQLDVSRGPAPESYRVHGLGVSTHGGIVPQVAPGTCTGCCPRVPRANHAEIGESNCTAVLPVPDLCRPSPLTLHSERRARTDKLREPLSALAACSGVVSRRQALCTGVSWADGLRSSLQHA